MVAALAEAEEVTLVVAPPVGAIILGAVIIAGVLYYVTRPATSTNGGSNSPTTSAVPDGAVPTAMPGGSTEPIDGRTPEGMTPAPQLPQAPQNGPDVPPTEPMVNVPTSQPGATIVDARPDPTIVGEHAGESIPARSTDRDFTADERREINRIGSETGCHTCGTTDPGTKSGNFVCDHQPPSARIGEGEKQRLYPQCITCSCSQGGIISKNPW